MKKMSRPLGEIFFTHTVYCVGADVKPCSINQSINWKTLADPEITVETSSR